jgi:hypothetical protein
VRGEKGEDSKSRGKSRRKECREKTIAKRGKKVKKR